MRFFLAIAGFIVINLSNPFFVYSQSSNTPVRNLEIFDRIVDSSFNELQDRLVLAGSDKIFALKIDDANDMDDYIIEKLRRKLSGFNVIYETRYDSVFADIKIDSVLLLAKYNKISTRNVLGDKMLDREIDVKYHISLVEKDNGKVLYEENFDESFSDSFRLDDKSRVETGGYRFLKANIPNEGFLSKYLLPTVLLAVSAVTIVLFFVIRSD